MRYQFAPLTEEQARAIGAWRYDPPYDLYDMDTDEESLRELLDQDTPYYGATDERGELVGFLCFKTAVQTLSGLLAGAYADPDTLDIGLGMRPDLTGRGLGLDFMNAGLAFARETFHPASFRLSVAAFNDRAIKVYKRAGFQPGHTFTHTAHTPRATNGVYEFMTMVRAAIVGKD